jgi:hypothetical protein
MHRIGDPAKDHKINCGKKILGIGENPQFPPSSSQKFGDLFCLLRLVGGYWNREVIR